jgi:hypothetical protein
MSTTNQELVDAVRKLVDAVIYAECTIAGSEDGDAVTVTVDAAIAVLRQIRAAEELSWLHKWADSRLLAHADDGRETLASFGLNDARPPDPA